MQDTRTACRVRVRRQATKLSPFRVSIYHRQRTEPAAPQAGGVTRPRVLLVMAGQGRSPLLKGLQALGIEIVQASNCSQARRILEARPDIRAVLVQVTLPDGDWRTVADTVAANCVNTEVVVLARFADETLRRDALESAAYDLLVEPYRHGDVGRVVGGAVLTSYRRHVGISEPGGGTRSTASHTHAA